MLNCLFVLLVHQDGYGQIPTKEWDKTIGGNATDTITLTLAIREGGYLLAGTSFSDTGIDRSEPSQGGADYWVVKTDASGNKLWDKRFGGTDNDFLTAAIQTAEGGYLLGGYSFSPTGGDKSETGRGGADYWIVKTDASGNKLWDKRFGGTNEDILISLLQNADGTYLLSGNSKSELGGDKSENSKTGEEFGRDYFDHWLIKISSSGVKLWDKTAGVYNNDGSATLIPAADGGFLLGGFEEEVIAYYAYDRENYILSKFDANGTQQWRKRFGGNNIDLLSAVVPTSDGGYLLGGSSISDLDQIGDKSEPARKDPNNNNTFDYWIVKTDAQGNKQWDKTYGGNQTDRLRAIIKTPDGGYLLAGNSNSTPSFEKTNSGKGSQDIWLVKINSSGVKQWDRAFGGSGMEGMASLLLTPDKGYLLSGYSNSPISGDKTAPSKGGYDFWLLKTFSEIPEPGVCVTRGSILREIWNNAPGKTVADIPVSTAPTSTSQLNSFEAPTNAGDNYGQRIRGYLCAPASGNYTFYIASDDNSELWLSTDTDPAKKVKIASVSYYTGVREWTKYPSQKSTAITLVAGKKYFIEALHKEEKYGDNIAVGWQQPGQTAIDVIPGNALSPVILPSIKITAPVQNTIVVPYTTITFIVDAADLEGSIQKVEFFNGTALIGQDTSYPYSITFPAQAIGANILTARVTNSAGIIVFSSPVTVYVNENAPGRIQWDKTLGAYDYDIFASLTATTDGGYLLGGGSYSGVSGDKTAASRGSIDYWIVKTDINGKRLWDKTFGGAGYDRLSAIINTNDGGFLLGGISSSGISVDKTTANMGEGDFWIIKIDASGKKLWDKSYGGISNDNLTSILPTNDGGYLLGGTSNSDYWIIKINSIGTEQWNKRIGGSLTDELLDLIQTTDGGYLLSGQSDSNVGGDKSQASRGSYDYWVVKIDGQGNKQWDKTFGGNTLDFLNDMIQTSDGGFLLAGGSESGAGGDKTDPQRSTTSWRDYWVVKINKNGVKEWDKAYGGNADDNLLSVLEKPNGNFLLGGYSHSNISGERTDLNRGNSDYWLVEIDKTGNKLWDKAYGNQGSEQIISILPAIDGGYILAGTSDSNAGNEKTENSKGVDDFWFVKLYSETSAICSATGSISQELWLNVAGSLVSDIPLNTAPTSTAQLTSFESTTNQGTNYGQRIRGYLCVPQNGTYTFYIAGDDRCELWLSTDDSPSKKVKIASVPYYTAVREWNKYPAQKSVAITLQAGSKYYIEALHKEANYSDNLAVGWQISSVAPITVIEGGYLSPYTPPVIATGKISREYWADMTGSSVSDIPLNTTPTSVNEITLFETTTNQGTNYGERVRGYLHPPVSGNYTFYVAGDDRCELYLSTDEDPNKKVKIASVTYYTAVKEWNKYTSQKSVAIALQAGRKYYIEALHKEANYSDNLAVGWSLPDQTSISVIAGTYLSPFLPAPSIARIGVEETTANQTLLYPNPFESKLFLGSAQPGKLYIAITDNLGRTLHQSTAQAETELDLAHLKAGVYVVKVSAEDGSTQVLKVVKK